MAGDVDTSSFLTMIAPTATLVAESSTRAELMVAVGSQPRAWVSRLVGQQH